MKSGIYKIINLTNNKIYVGSSNKILRRWRTHKSGLRRNCHSNLILQNSYNIHGTNSFNFEIIELCPIEKLIERENFYINSLKSTTKDGNYNIGMAAENGMLNRHHTEGTKRIISEKRKGKYSEKNSPMYGRPGTRLGIPFPEHMKKKFSEERKEKK